MQHQKLTTDELRAVVLADRQGSYIRLRGGFPVPLAGVVYWLALGVAGYSLELGAWSQLAFFGSGAIFPLALLFAKIFKNDFMKDKTTTGSVLVPTFISMLLFWAFIVAAAQEGQALIPLILAVGLSLHWPVIGWNYGRAALFSAHAVIRAVIAVLIWTYFPEHRLTWLPFSVAAVYALTVLAIFWDSGRLSKNTAHVHMA